MSLSNLHPDSTVSPPSDISGSPGDRELDELLTVDDVATLLKVSRSWVYEHTRSRRKSPSECLPHMKVGKYVRFEARALRAFLEKKCRTR
jgi:excisionase family DNA binding protein